MGDNLKGIFIVFEGIDGTGKSTQLGLLGKALQERGCPVLITREPGGTRLGEAIRGLLLDPAYTEMVEQAEAFLYAAARAQCVREVVVPALQKGYYVLCDRYADSTLAYQGFGRGLDLEFLRRVNDLATGGVYPDLTVVLDLDVELAARRMIGARDRMELQQKAFYRRVRQGYLELAARCPEAYQVLDAAADPAELAAAILARVEGLRP
ncbi:dTMP kinase [Desulforudis sp. 1088]|uniref:dTMP kinase n=1 Tax=unclassified Candidatus Desulforudis TaxID=2635950 RepID=UPI003CF0CF26